MNNEPWRPSAEPQPNSPTDQFNSGEIQQAEQPLTVHGSIQGSQMPAPKKKSKLKLAIIIAAAVALVSGGSALAYSFWYQNPDKVIADALANSFSANSLKVDGSISVDSEDDGKGGVDFIASLDTSSMAGSIDFDVNFEAENQDAVDIKASAVYADGSLFARLNNTSDIIGVVLGQSGLDTDSAAFKALADSVDNKWIQLHDPESDAEVSEEYTCSMEVLRSIDSEKVASEVKDLYRSNRFIIVAEKLGAKDINGTTSLGYTLDIDEEVLEQFTEGLNDTSFGKQLAECTDEEPFDLGESNDNDSSDSEDPTFNVWISRWGHELTRIELFDDEVRLGADFSYNEDVSVSVPEDSMSVEEFLEQLQAAVMTYYLQQIEGQLEGGYFFDGSTEPSAPNLFL